MERLTFSKGFEDGVDDGLKGLSSDFIEAHLSRHPKWRAGYIAGRRSVEG